MKWKLFSNNFAALQNIDPFNVTQVFSGSLKIVVVRSVNFYFLGLMNQTKVCIAVSSQQYIMIDEQIAFCLLITTQKADDHRRLGPCKTMAQIPFDSSPEGPNERSKCPKHRERGQENFFC